MYYYKIMLWKIQTEPNSTMNYGLVQMDIHYSLHFMEKVKANTAF